MSSTTKRGITPGSQAQRILSRLQDAATYAGDDEDKGWVSVLDIMSPDGGGPIMQYNRVIHTLRNRYGYYISNKIISGGSTSKTNSWFRLFGRNNTQQVGVACG